MRRVGLLLLGWFLCGVRGYEDTPDLLSMVTKLQTQVQTLQNQVQTLESSQRHTQTAVHVGFSASFSENIAEATIATTTAMTLKYQNVLTNTGNGFNANTGVFSAPLKGLYVFHLSAYALTVSPPFFGPVLKRNGVALADPLVMHTAGGHYPVTRAVVLALEPGDRVYVELPANAFFTAGTFGKLNAFSGFLLTAM